MAVLQRAGDAEGSMRGLVTKICAEMWFTEASSFAGKPMRVLCASVSLAHRRTDMSWHSSND